MLLLYCYNRMKGGFTLLLRQACEQAREQMIKELRRKNHQETLDETRLSQCSLTELKNTLMDQ